ncbi:MAG: GNAT family N-acetyltransferase [Chloroflexota bacterium]
MTVRPATRADLAAITAILEANDEPVTWPGVDRAPYVEHLLSRPGLRLVVGELDGTVAGIAGSIAFGRPDRRFLTDLYVDPRRQSQGLGRRMLDAAMEGATERMTFSSSDRRALAAYIRNGMRPWWPLLYLEVDVARLPAAISGEEARSADVAGTARLSRAWTGIDRTDDFAHYASLPDAVGFIVTIDGQHAAVGWACREIAEPGRWLNHATIAPDADPVRAAFGILRAAGSGGRIGAAVPGPHPAVPHLLDAGVRIGGTDTFCATDRDLLDARPIFPSPGLL